MPTTLNMFLSAINQGNGLALASSAAIEYSRRGERQPIVNHMGLASHTTGRKFSRTIVERCRNSRFGICLLICGPRNRSSERGVCPHSRSHKSNVIAEKGNAQCHLCSATWRPMLRCSTTPARNCSYPPRGNRNPSCCSFYGI